MIYENTEVSTPMSDNVHCVNRAKLTSKTLIPGGVVLEFGDADAEAYIDLGALPLPDPSHANTMPNSTPNKP